MGEPLWMELRDQHLDGMCDCGTQYNPKDSFCGNCGRRLIAFLDQMNARRDVLYSYKEKKIPYIEGAVVLDWVLHGPQKFFDQADPFPPRERITRVIEDLAVLDDSTKVPNLAGRVRGYLLDARKALGG